MNQLVPCPECQRHVNVDEPACPFCAAELDLSATPAPALPRTRLGRAATFAFGATVLGAALAAGCGGDDDDDDDDGKAGAAAAGNSNGGAGGTAGASAGRANTAGSGATAGAQAVYGAPPDPSER